MGTYISQSDLETLVGEALLISLTNKNQAATTIDTDVVAEVIADAEAEINSYLGARYALPLNEPYPRLVLQLTKRLARWHLYQQAPGTEDESITKDYDRIIAQLRDVAAGKIDLGLATDDSASGQATSPGATVRFGSGGGRRFSRSKFKGF